jgi:DNA-binding CsgD family transcriptional regulator/uncharacterized membrane protein
MSETANQTPRKVGMQVVGWWRLRQVRRGVLVASVLVGCFLWAMSFVGLAFAMVERGVRQWWLVLVFGLLVLVVAVAAAYAVLASFRRVNDAQGETRPTPEPPTGHGDRSPAASAVVQPPRHPAAAGLPVEPLTRQELEVLARLAAGRSNNEIAKELYVAPGTVKAHLNRIFRKLRAASRLQAVAHAREAGLLNGGSEK